MDLAFGWVVLAGLLEPVWVVSLKRYNSTHQYRWGAVVVLFMIIGPACLSLATGGDIPVSVAYAVWVSIGTVMTVAVGRYVYYDPFDGKTVLFLGMILVGVVGLYLLEG
ncbi:MAG: multidrug efflux SMR transporter [Candidatus Methanomethylophilaceae archaeon]|nr:multidrug efflux SMR transporter [Candidatus Methanomethylophilaceae archaeon]